MKSKGSSRRPRGEAIERELRSLRDQAQLASGFRPQARHQGSSTHVPPPDEKKHPQQQHQQQQQQQQRSTFSKQGGETGREFTSLHTLTASCPTFLHELTLLLSVGQGHHPSPFTCPPGGCWRYKTARSPRAYGKGIALAARGRNSTKNVDRAGCRHRHRIQQCIVYHLIRRVFFASIYPFIITRSYLVPYETP